jgi:hypothetical protein
VHDPLYQRQMREQRLVRCRVLARALTQLLAIGSRIKGLTVDDQKLFLILEKWVLAFGWRAAKKLWSPLSDLIPENFTTLPEGF